MPFLNLGWPEILFILILGFLVLGPDRITKTAGELGQWLNKMKRNETFREVVKTTDEIRSYPRKIMDEVRFEDAMKLGDPLGGAEQTAKHPMRTSGSLRDDPPENDEDTEA